MSFIIYPTESNDTIVDKTKINYCEKCDAFTKMHLKLRQCQHTICVKCALFYLKSSIEQDKIRIKCINDNCKENIHENDIVMLLDTKNNNLDTFSDKLERQYLLYKHEKETIFYALGGRELTRQCPQCRNIFQREPGCNYVRCPNLRCNTWFCFECTATFPGWQHFSKGTCKISWDDIWKGAYLFRFLLTTNGFILFAILPIVCVFLIILLPIFITISLPTSILKQIYLNKANLKNKKENLKVEYCLYCLILLPLLILIGLILGIFSIFTGILLFIFYCFLMILKCLPFIGQIDIIINLVSTITSLFGMRSWRQILIDSKTKKQMKIINKEHKKSEKTELN